MDSQGCLNRGFNGFNGLMRGGLGALVKSRDLMDSDKNLFLMLSLWLKPYLNFCDCQGQLRMIRMDSLNFYLKTCRVI